MHTRTAPRYTTLVAHRTPTRRGYPAPGLHTHSTTAASRLRAWHEPAGSILHDVTYGLSFGMRYAVRKAVGLSLYPEASPGRGWGRLEDRQRRWRREVGGAKVGPLWMSASMLGGLSGGPGEWGPAIPRPIGPY